MNRHTPPRSSSRRPSTSVSGRRYPRGKHAETLQTRTLARLATYADGYDIPVLVTRTKRNDFTASGVTAADHHLECEQTRMGPRVVGDGFETLVYPSTTVRTTRRRSRTGGSCSQRAPRRSAWNRRRRRRRRRLRKASGRVSQLTVRRSQPPRIPCLMRGPRLGQEADSDGANESDIPGCAASHRRALGGFRRALRRHDQPRFDRLFEYAREHALTRAAC